MTLRGIFHPREHNGDGSEKISSIHGSQKNECKSGQAGRMGLFLKRVPWSNLQTVSDGY